MKRPAWFGSEPDIIVATRKRIALAKRRKEAAKVTARSKSTPDILRSDD